MTRVRLDVLLRVLRRMGLGARFVVVDAAVHLVNAVELRPDALLIDADTGRWLALEVQLQIDEEKRTMWPLLAAYLTRKHGTMGDVLVITPTRASRRGRRRGGTSKARSDQAMASRPRCCSSASARPTRC
jgi:hypothetical protein